MARTAAREQAAAFWWCPHCAGNDPDCQHVQLEDTREYVVIPKRDWRNHPSFRVTGEQAALEQAWRYREEHGMGCLIVERGDVIVRHDIPNPKAKRKAAA